VLRRSLVVVVVTAAAVVMAATPVAAAIRPFNPQQTLVGGCAASDADAVVTAGGKVLGFATCPSPSGESIRFFQRNADGTVNPSESSGFVGRVLGVSYDNTATYVLFQSGNDVRIGKRTHAGAFSSRVVDSGVGGALTSGDVIAKSGQWFGVWSKQVGPGGEFAQTELFSAGSATAVHRVTMTAGTVDDVQPTLAYSLSTPVLIWSRIQGTDEASIHADLYVTKFIGGTWQGTRVFASAGTSNLVPDMRVADGRTFVAWHRDGFIVVASNATGSFTSHRFNTGGFAPSVGTSVTFTNLDHIFVSWTSFSQDRVFFAETSGASVTGIWNGAHIGPAGSLAFATGGFNTKGTAVYGTGTSVASRTQA
jgi:hypothetical protein